MTEPRKRGRPSKYKNGLVTEPTYVESHPQKLLELMAQGYLDCQIFAYFNVCKDTFYRWLNEHDDFRQAYDIGLPKCEAYWVKRIQDRFEAGDDKGFKYCISIMNNKFNWGKEESRATNQSITIGNINVLQQKSRGDLLEYIQDALIRNKDVIDVNLLEVHEESRKSE